MIINKHNINLFIRIDVLSCASNNIDSIEDIPDYIKHIYCGNNNLTILPDLPHRLEQLNCVRNNLTSIPILPESLEFFYCNDNDLQYETKEAFDNNWVKNHNKLISRSKRIKSILNNE